MKVAFGPFAPDQIPNSAYIVGGQNVLPLSDKSYGPIETFAPVYTALPLRCQGAFYSIDSAGNTGIWAGTAGKLYNLFSGAAFSDVTKVATTYALASTDYWEYVQYGQRVIASQIGDAMQAWTLNSSANFIDLSASAPKAKHIAVVANFLMAGNTSDGTFGAQPDGLWWSAVGDPTSWPTVGTSAAAAVQSGRVNISGGGGAIQRIVPKVGSLDAVILQERQISRCVYVGTPDVFQFQPLEGARGTPCPQSCQVYGGLMYYIGEDLAFYACDGTQSIPIGAGTVDKFFHDDVNQSQISRVVASMDPENKLYCVAYPSNNSTGTPDRILFYNYASQQWAPPTLQSTEFLTRYGSVGYTLEQLDAFGNMDSLNVSLDSRAWMGSGKPSFAAFDANHQAGFFSGACMVAIIEMGDADLDSSRILTQNIRPLISGDGTTVATVSLGTRQNLNTLVTYGDYGSLNRENVVPLRVNSRYVRVLVKLTQAGGYWYHAAGVDADAILMSKIA